MEERGWSRLMRLVHSASIGLGIVQPHVASLNEEVRDMEVVVVPQKLPPGGSAGSSARMYTRCK